MQYSPKLKRVIEQMKKICEKEDIGAIIVLHVPGFSEYTMMMSPSYSCVIREPDMIRVRAKIADFNGDKKAWGVKVGDTSNMLNMLGETTGHVALNIMKLAQMLDEKVGTEHQDKGFSDHTAQNN